METIVSKKTTISQSRRQLVLGATTAAALGAVAPAIVRAQAGPIRLGHLTPRTGFLGPMGEYAVMGATLAVVKGSAAGVDGTFAVELPVHIFRSAAGRSANGGTPGCCRSRS